MAAEVRSSTVFEWVLVPDIVPWDDEAGEPADPIAANVLIRFAIVPAGAADPAEADYKPGAWRLSSGKFSGRFSVGSEGAVAVAGSEGVFDIWCAIDGVQSKPRRKVGQLVVA